MKFRFFKKLMLSLCILLVGSSIFSQQTIADATDVTVFNNALKLYNTKAYAAAQKTFAKVNEFAAIGSNLKSDASYYEAMCAIKLNQTDADKKVLAFVEEHPNSNKKNEAFLNVANYYFGNKRAAYALKWFQKVAIDELSRENQKELNFKMGYSLLVTNNLELAKARFLPLINDGKYGNESRYYYGFISYKLEDYGVAESTLKEIAENASYKAEISYYLLDISFKSGKFERCIEVGLELLPTIDRKLKSDVSKIIGESYFNLEKYAASIPYLKAYKGKKGKWNNTDFYQLGYANYKQNDFENAVNNFNKIIDQNNTVSQNAYYHLGECYMNLEKKAEALNAFKSASEMDFDKSIQEDAALNYAKLSYEAGNPFEPVSEVLQAYLKNYPKSKAYKEINELVVSSFLNQQDYEGALKYLSEKKSLENIQLSLEVSLYRGIQLFNENNYTEALPYLAKGKKSETKEVKLRAQYWEAETKYRLEDYKDALTKFIILNKSLTAHKKDDFVLVDYNIGYSHFKLKEYEKAGEAFKDFLKLDSISEDLKYDAFIRLGDSYFATTNYKKAIQSYKNVTDNFGLGADYATYQIGMSYGFIDRNKDKIQSLKKVINDYEVSNLKDDALYQLANTYTKLKEPKNAHFAYDRLLEKHPKSIFLSRALLRQGLLYYNDGKNQQSLMKYKEVAARFPNSPDALEAVANARNVYIDEGNLEDYVNWISTLKFVNITNSEIDNTTFAVAEKKYLESNASKEIIKSLQKYIREFPEGIHKLKANYYLADVFFKTKEFRKAISNYQVIIDQDPSEFTEESLNKLSQIYLEQNEFNNALPLLDRLEQVAYISENILFAQSNLMKGYYETEAYDLAIVYAKKILQKDKLDTQVENDAKLIIARSSIKNEDISTAEAYYTAIEKTANGALKAEALYYNAYFKNQQKEYESSNKIVQKLIATYAAYKYWAVKSYVIMGKNYYDLNDIYQATFVLENVIKNFKEFDDIVKEAQIELNTIKENEAKTNNSVTPEKKN
ncbi:tetratricopeptide repeat protein [uncultured Polaribacter sp.]|uniref:tetratricopeptide repeat protein n=1 Tax=uncultured Polaribacter sp. TaxID=174711 RepID=UPI002630FF49|nr:tetratricopeptide repeat protein [uncultured Polaribacter sp.]